MKAFMKVAVLTNISINKGCQKFPVIAIKVLQILPFSEVLSVFQKGGEFWLIFLKFRNFNFVAIDC